MRLGELAQKLDCELAGNPDVEITGAAGMEHACPGQLTFLANLTYAPKVKFTKASAILVSEAIAGLPIASLVSANPYLDFARALALFYQPPRPKPGISPLASIAPSASIGENPSIGPFAVVGDRVKLGRNAVLHPHSVIYEGAEIGDDFLAHSHAVVREFCRVGNRLILQISAVIGGDGFGFAKQADGTHYKIVQSGVTVIEDDVEIQALTGVDRATVGETRVKRGAKIDSLVQIGHASVVGEDNIICAQTGLAGSSVLERNVLLAGQVGVSGHLTIHQNAANVWLRAITAFPKLPELVRTVRELKRRIESLEKK
jgi:UDP-3-O-[3-hydroxymyristoyl] glucosamine N-acyltransferase